MHKLATIVLLVTLSSCDYFSQKYPTAMYRGDTARTGFLQDSMKMPTSLKWKYKTNGKIFAAPLVTQKYIYVGSSDSAVYCFTKEGELKWKYTTHGGVNSTPVLYENRIFFISEDGNIYAIDANSGKEKWVFTTKGEKEFVKKGLYGLRPLNIDHSDLWDLFLSSPMIYKNRIVVGGGDHYIYGLDPEDARMMFRFVGNEIVHSSMAGAYNMVYVGCWDGYIYALDAVTGIELWRQSAGQDSTNYKMQGIQGTPAIADSLLIVPSRDSYLYAMHVKKGEIKWKHDNDSSWLVSSPAIADNNVYFTTLDDHMLKSVHLHTGRLIYKTNIGSYNLASPVIAGNKLVLATLAGELQIYDRITGEKLWSWQTDGSKNNPDGLIKEDGTMDKTMIFKTSNYYEHRDSMNKILSSGAIISEPVVHGNNIYLTSTDSTLYVLQ
jgi:eukaryotic-like serine/threonine-protein kinase